MNLKLADTAGNTEVINYQQIKGKENMKYKCVFLPYFNKKFSLIYMSIFYLKNYLRF